MPSWFRVLLLVLLVSAALLALDRLGLWLESRGWIYYRKVPPKGGGMAAGLRAFQGLIEPEVRHVQEDREQHAAASDRADRGKVDPPAGPS
jgi:hypothetical protein